MKNLRCVWRIFDEEVDGYVLFGSEQYRQISDIRVHGKYVLKFGDYVSGDEKLFRYTGASGFVRMVINKPARLGLWMY